MRRQSRVQSVGGEAHSGADDRCAEGRRYETVGNLDDPTALDRTQLYHRGRAQAATPQEGTDRHDIT